VFVDGHFAGTVNQFRGVGRAMLIEPGSHHIKIDLVGYQPFETDVKLLAKQKITIKTDLAPGTIQQADPAVKNN
jgi:PEGA domain